MPAQQALDLARILEDLPVWDYEDHPRRPCLTCPACGGHVMWRRRTSSAWYVKCVCTGCDLDVDARVAPKNSRAGAEP